MYWKECVALPKCFSKRIFPLPFYNVCICFKILTWNVGWKYMQYYWKLLLALTVATYKALQFLLQVPNLWSRIFFFPYQARLLGTLAVSRGLGDHHLKVIETDVEVKPFLSCIPKVWKQNYQLLCSASMSFWAISLLLWSSTPTT